MYNLFAKAHQAKASSHLQCTIFILHHNLLSWILNINEEKGVARHALACLSAFLPLYNETELVYCHPATTNFNKRTDNRPDHVSQESVRTYNEHPAAIAQVFPFCFRNLAESSLNIGMRFAETSKVFIFKQDFSRFVHLVEIQVEMTLIRIVPLEWILVGVNKVIIGSESSRESGVKFVVNLFYFVN